MLATLLLCVALVRVNVLDRANGLDADTLTRDQVALALSSTVFTTMEALADYRRLTELGAPQIIVDSARRDVDRRMAAVGARYTTDGAMLDLKDRWIAADAAWKIARGRRSAGSIIALDATAARLQALLDGNADANLNYDPDQTTQDLMDLAMLTPPRAYELVARAQVLAQQAIERNGMSLERRVILANALLNLRGLVDQSSDHITTNVERIGRMLPSDGAVAVLPAQVARYDATVAEFRHILAGGVLTESVPHVPPGVVDARASAALTAAATLRSAASSTLGAYLMARREVARQRSNAIVVALILAGLLVAGLTMVVSRLMVRRERRALRRARAETARLSAELARERAEAALRVTEAQFQAVFEGAAIGIAILDRSGTIVNANEVFRTFFGEHPELALAGHETEIAGLLRGERETLDFEQHFDDAAGRELWTDATVSVVNGAEGEPQLAICMFRDKTDLKHNERRMQYDKTHDALTGLPNRWLFEEHLRRRFEEATALLDSFFAVLFVDLERFRDVNESLGHGAGDGVLTAVAQRLLASVDSRDVVARWGSDEFAVLIRSLGDILHVESIARRILNNLSKAIAVDERSIYLGASVGIAIGSASYERAGDVMRDAETAMQHAKGGGGTRYALFDSKMHARAQKRLQLSSDIRNALARDEFRLLYQPIVTLADGVPTGCEALLRWDHPTEGVMTPSEFMPLAEQTGLAIPIGRFVMDTACRQLSIWRRNRASELSFGLHVNVSVAELVDAEFERFLVQTLERHGLLPHDVTIEITESVVLDSGTRANVALDRLRARGVQLCIDDFGTGYSSMRYLQQFKVDAIKIDRSFVSGTDGELASEPIVRTLITLAEAYDVRIVAEGVETARQREMLRNAGCRLAQGFLYARPLTPAELIARYPEILGRSPRSASA